MNKDRQKFEKLSFWELLETRSVEIPIIQRDYAQGRARKEKVRNDFLNALKQALAGNPVELDFIYGSENNNVLQPLDGQQRLTTLFLLHWFIADRERKLEEAKSRLSKFTYETRTSSREFCKELSNSNIEISDVKVSDAIKDQSWFVDFWKKDPTISAMLTMLDAIQHKFKGIPDLWDKLTDEKNPSITFLHIKLKDFGLSDDLYVKMNARGKALTAFENFKADLVGYLKRKTESESWKTFDVSGFERKLDTDWTDIFWKNRSSKHKIDDIYFAFLNRYFLNALITAKKVDEYLCKGENWEKDNKTFQTLYGEKSNEYNSFEIYNPKENEDDVFSRITYKHLANILDNFHNAFKDQEWGKEKISKLFFHSWENSQNESSFYFISDQEKSISTLTHAQRVVFHAVCRYFEQGQYEESTLKQWMRVVWNIVENTNTNPIQSMIGIIRLVDELADHSHDIYAFLSNLDNKISSAAAKDQVEEERAKAKQIINDTTETWESKIIEAEKYAFFKGAIRFLYTNEDGHHDWKLFENKFTNAKRYFDAKGNGVTSDFRKGAILLKSLISKVANPQETLERKELKIFNHDASTWKEILTNSNLRTTVSSVLSGELSAKQASKIKWHRKLYETDLLVYIAEQRPQSRIHEFIGKAIYPRHGIGVFLEKDKRDNILSQLLDKEKISLTKGPSPNSKGERIPNTNLFFGWDITFEYKEHKYRWSRHDHIYLLKENGDIAIDADGKDIGIPCADVNAENITEKLDSLILNQYKLNKEMI
jgi:hypothetical protein